MPGDKRTRIRLDAVSTDSHVHPAINVINAEEADVCENLELLGGKSHIPNKDGFKSQKRKIRHHNPNQKHHPNHFARVHLSQSSDLNNDIVRFHVEQPNRVAVRLELLMDTAEVRLNDKEYMRKLYSKLVEDESLKMKHYLKDRVTNERERVKDLVVNGKMEPPEDLHYLYKHPVFRVNAMLARLQDQNNIFYAPFKPKETAVAIEPFEFDASGKFFTHLHQTGTLWIPSEEILAREEKLKGKIARARQRLIEKRHHEAEEAKTMRLLYKSDEEKGITDDYQSMTSGSSATPAIESDNSLEKEERAKMRHKNEFSHQLREESRMAAKDKQRRELLQKREKDRLAKQEARMKLRDKKFLDEKEEERKKIIERHRERLSKYDDPMPPPRVQPALKRSTLASIFKMNDTPPHLKEDESFKKLRKNYNLRGSDRFESYRPPNNPLIAKYLDSSKDAEHLFQYGKAVKGVYDREQRMADDFMIKLNRML